MAALISGCAGEPAGEPVCYATASLGAYACQPEQMPLHRLPLRAGYRTQVVQGMHAEPTHRDEAAYGIDLACREGDVVVASRAGVVWAVREDSTTGCADRSCVDDANYVLLDHGDGTFSEYQHLQPMGALVEEGDQVCAGQAIGLCGATGYTTGPHLHFAVSDAARQSIPTRFEEISAAQSGWGLAAPGGIYTSRNELVASCAPVTPSRLHRLAFAHQGIELDESVATTHRVGAEAVALRGSYYGPLTHVAALRQRAGEPGGLVSECVEVGEDGRFEVSLLWPRARFAGGVYLFMLTGANDACDHTGSAWAYHLSVIGPMIFDGSERRAEPKR